MRSALGSGTEIIPGISSDIRIKPLPLANGHGRYITVTPERTFFGEWPLHIAVKFITVSLPKRLCSRYITEAKL